MRTQSRTRLSWPALATLAMALGAPSLANAQQGGLFPLAPIRRERVPCAVEDPVYKLYRQEYFGYHPTCWRRFPTGWGCPSPEAPNAAESYRLIPRDAPPPGYGPDEEGMEGGEEMGPGEEGQQRPDGANQPPNTLPPLPSGERSPFELDPRPSSPPPADSPAPITPPTDPATPPAADRVEVVPAPTDAEQPMLALPDPTVNPTADFGTYEGKRELAGTPPLPDLSVPAAHNHDKAPKRTGFLGRLFGGRTVRR